jgi:hypothetical protein
LFGFFHCPTRRYLPYCFWAASAGLFLGWLLLTFNSLWTPILAHGLSNLVVLLYLRFGRKQPMVGDSTSSTTVKAETIKTHSQTETQAKVTIATPMTSQSITKSPEAQLAETPLAAPPEERDSCATDETKNSDRSV